MGIKSGAYGDQTEDLPIGGVKEERDEYGILVTNRSGFLRVSPHIDNTTEEITFFLTSLRVILNILSP